MQHMLTSSNIPDVPIHTKPLTDLTDALAVRQVICDDLAEFWEVPAVPFPTAHDVVIELFIQIIQQGCK